jgi:hypothetical protein
MYDFNDDPAFLLRVSQQNEESFDPLTLKNIGSSFNKIGGFRSL